MLCDRCEIAAVLRRRHQLGDMPDGVILARLYVSMAFVADDSVAELSESESVILSRDPGNLADASR